LSKFGGQISHIQLIKNKILKNMPLFVTFKLIIKDISTNFEYVEDLTINKNRISEIEETKDVNVFKRIIKQDKSKNFKKLTTLKIESCGEIITYYTDEPKKDVIERCNKSTN